MPPHGAGAVGRGAPGPPPDSPHHPTDDAALTVVDVDHQRPAVPVVPDRRVVRRFQFLMACSGVGLGMTAPMTAVYAKSFGASDAAAGVAVAAVAVSLLAVDVLGTRFVPRIDPRAAVGAATVIFGIGSLVAAVAPGYGFIVLARAVQGVGGALAMGGGLQFVVRTAGPGGVGQAIGSFNAAWFGGVALGPPISGAISQLAAGQIGLRYAWVACAAIQGVAAVAARLWLPPLPSTKAPTIGLPRLHDIGGSRAFPPLALGAFGQGLRGAVVMTLLPLHGVALGLSRAGVGGALFALSCTDIASSKATGSLSDRFGPGAVLAVVLAASSVAAVAGSAVGDLWGFVAVALVLGTAVGAARVVPPAMVVDVVDDTEAGLAGYRIAADVGMLVGSILMGVTVGLAGTRGAMGWLAAALVGAATFSIWAGRRARAAHPSVLGAATRDWPELLPPER